MKKLALALAVVMIFSLAFSGCGPKTENPSGTDATTPSTDNQPAGSELAVCIGPDPETIDPALNSAVDGASLIIHAFEGLMTLDQGGSVVPGQAETYEVSDDGLNWTFHLRDGLKWSDGQPLTAADFEWSWKRAVSPDTAAPYGEFFNVIAGYDAAAAGDFDALQVKATDDKTLTVTLAAPCGYFTQLLAFPTYVPVRKDMVEANGEAWATQVSSYISNGPYKMIEWTPGEYIKYAKNENYWNYDALCSDTIKFLLIEDPNAVLTAYQSGEIVCAKDLPSQEIPALRETEDFHLDDLMGTYYISLNTKREPFDNAKLRQALSLAIDRNYIANTVMQGTYTPATAFVGPGLLDADGKTPFIDNSPLFIDPNDYEGNLEKAKQLMVEAGYPNGEGLREIEYFTNQQGYHKPVAEALQQMWAELGVKLNVQVADWAVVTADRRQGNYDIARNGWVFDYNDPSSMLDLFTTTNGNNDGKYSNPEYDKLMETARTTGDANVRFDSMHQAEQLLMDEAGAIPVAFYSEFYLLNPKVKGFWHSPLGYFYFMYATVE